MAVLRRRTMLVLLAVFVVIASLVTASPAGAEPGLSSTVFINEIHYDNASTDAGEFVEVAGPAGTDLTGWSVVLYNGNGGAVYNTVVLTTVLADAGGGYGFEPRPITGIQNGSPDGLALVDAGGDVVQFLSYEGSFTAVGGPADGLTSADIGVTEASSTLVGESLQLTGTGTAAGDFTWSGPSPASPGAANSGQTFSGGGGPLPPVLNEFSVNTTGTDLEYLEIAGSPDTDYSTYQVLAIQAITEGADGPGDIIDVFPMGTTDAGGLYVNNLAANTIENDPITLLLVEGFSGMIGDDLDTDDDGVPDSAPWISLADGVSIQYAVGGVAGLTYSATVLDEAFDDATYSGSSAGFAPGGASRVPDRTGGWVRNDFDLAGPEAGTPEDGEAQNTPGTTNELVVVVPTLRRIHDVQGSGPSVAIAGPVEVQAVVTSLFQRDDVLDGFFIQEEDADIDADPNTSEGIFVFCRGACPAAVAVGDLVTVSGTGNDFFGMSQISTDGGSIVIHSSANPLPKPTALSLPADGRTDAEPTFEPYEGMIVSFADTLAVSEYFNLARYGEIVLTDKSRPEQFTDTNAPSVAGYAAFLDDLATRRIILDDDDNDQNDSTSDLLNNEPYPYPVGGLSTTNFFRGGDTITGLTGVLHWSFAGQPGTDAWRVRQVPTEDYTFTAANPRPSAPAAVGGTLRVASFNVLNYFLTLDQPGATCGPSGIGCRGANSAEELSRQRSKIVAALSEIDADVVGLIEIENDAGAAVADLVAGLNAVAGAGTYAYIDTGTIGGDAIKVALIYRPAAVAPLGSHAVLDSSVDPTFIDTKNRPVLIQTFEEVATGARFTVAVNHLKSKGSPCDDVGDPGLNDGQANCAGTRTAAAQALANYLATDPTGSGDGDVLIIGDINAYAMEDPITALQGAGYTDLIESFVGPDAYSFVFDGQLGYLDHALANDALKPQVTGVATWHINADEVNLLDYNDDIQDPGEASFERESNALNLYEPDPYRSSDHDPVIVGLLLGGGEPVLACGSLRGTEAELEAAGYNVIVGTAGRDFLWGSRGADVIVAGAGNDFVWGFSGDDIICGGEGRDLLVGNRGDDQLYGDEGDDILWGGSGTDVCDGGPENRRDRAARSCETIIDVP